MRQTRERYHKRPKKKNESRANSAGMNAKMEINASRSKSRQSCQPLGHFQRGVHLIPIAVHPSVYM